MSNASSYGTVASGVWGGETDIKNICTDYGTLLRVLDVAIRADEDERNFNYCDAQFYVDTAPWYFDLNSTDPVLLYRFRPVSQEHKYLGNSGGHIVLMDVPCENTSSHYGMLCKSSYNFIPEIDVGGHFTFLLRSSSSSGLPQYMSINPYHEVIVSPSPSLFLLSEPSQRPCKKEMEFNLYNTELECKPVDVKLKVTSRPADTMSYRRQLHRWREEISVQYKMKR